MKEVLIIHYSQSGQLESIAKNIAKPLLSSKDVNVTFHEIQPVKPFPFPWNKATFFDVFPESFLQIPCIIKPVPNEILNRKYDLILLHYQVWYLSPSIPINSFLKSDDAKKLLNNTPVVTISGSRNMWVMTQEKVKSLLKQSNAILKGNIALVDRARNLTSVITIVKWMFTGEKNKYLGLFPKPGVSEKDIQESIKYGEVIQDCIDRNNFNDLQSKIVALNGVRINSYLASIDKTGNRLFAKWANFIITKRHSRKAWLKVFSIYLLLALFLISPVVYLLHVFISPVRINKRRKERQYYQGVL